MVRPLLAFGALLGIAVSAVRAQYEIDEMFSTTWNSSKVVEYSNPAIKFVPGPALTQSVNSTATTPDVVGIKVLDKQVHQKVDKIGAGITDAASIVLQAFKEAHPDDYWTLLHLLFSQDPEWVQRGGAGLNAVRSPLGASDFGLAPYSYDDVFDGSTDPQFKLFTIDKAPKLWQTLQDIIKVNPNVKTYFAPWSQPGWMKADYPGSQPLFGGHLIDGYEDLMAQYLVKAMVAIRDEKGIQPYSLSVHSHYPTSRSNPSQLAKLGIATRRRLDEAGFKDIQLLGLDHNWDHPQEVLDMFDMSRDDTWDGVAYHGYAGDPRTQIQFTDAYEDKSVHFTEYTTVTQNFNEPWPNLKEKSTKILFKSVRYKSESIILWNACLQVDEDGFTTPHLLNVCQNCLAPIHLQPNATNGNATAALADPSGSKMRTLGMADGTATANGTTAPAAAAAAPAPADSKRTHKQRRRALTPHSITPRANAVPAAVAQSVNATTPKPVNQAPFQQSSYYKRTSDFSFLSHVSLAVRPRVAGGQYGRLIGTSSTEKPAPNDDGSTPDPVAGRVLASLFRSDNVDPSNAELSRFSLVLLNQNDHYGTQNMEDITVTIAFRGTVANVTLGVGLYTMSWLANKTSDLPESA
ncbi:related to beta-1,6-glucanase precursor [Pseudozyma flocculosa]|uniref:Related to beta-1,6-glucanase n=1 Tax=Pseudozyma flocculosa TaxID=84751 RepID=A0A5C3F362_9BASI|nr:related to beta-1,6-glucanase precursor [Pseudozyma flocculosa]